MAPTALMLLLIAASDLPPGRVLVVTYQALGVEPEQIDELTNAAASAVAGTSRVAVPSDEARGLRRAATMCGEDAPCLSTVASWAQAAFALGLGFGRMGSGLLVTAVLVDARGKKLGAASRRLSAGEPVAVAIRAMAAKLLEAAPALAPPQPPAQPPLLAVDIPREAKVKPGESALEEPNVAVVETRRFRSGAIGTTVATGALAAAAIAIGVAAGSSYSALSGTPPADRPAADSRQRTINAAGDACGIAAVVAGVVSLTLWILDGREPTGQEVRP